MGERHNARDWTCVTIVSPVYPNVSEEREMRRQLREVPLHPFLMFL